MWWELFHRCGFTEVEHIEDRATLGGLIYAGEVEQVKRSVVHRYRFPEQPHEIEVGDSRRTPPPPSPVISNGDSAGRWSRSTKPPARST